MTMLILLVAFFVTLPRGIAAQDNDVTIRHIVSNYSLSGEYDAVEFHSGLPTSVKPLGDPESCLSYARTIEEPYTSHYWPRINLSLEYPWTKIKRAYREWDGPITREMFEKALQKSPACCGPTCLCYIVAHYKIINGRLWRPADCDNSCEARRAFTEEMLQVI